MPVYEYRCRDCGHELEVMQRITADPLLDCPQCEAPSLQRLISQTSFILKGSGWYVTDYKKPNEGKNNGAASRSEGASSARSDSEAPSTPASNSDSGANSGSKAGDSSPSAASPASSGSKSGAPSKSSD